MGSKINHDLRSFDGATIYHGQEVDGATGPGNLKIPNIFEEDDAAKYPIGTRLVLGDRVFHYSYFPEAITYTAAGVISYTGRLAQPPSYDVSQPAGTVELKVNGSVAGTPAANLYAGGYAKIGSAVNSPTMKIIKSTASALDPDTEVQTVILTLEQGVPYEVGVDTQVDIFPCRYADVREAWLSVNSAESKPFVGVPPRLFTALHYGWIQTWGPCFLVCTNTELGDVAFDRVAVFSADGSIEPCVEAWHDGQIASQIAGYTLAIGGAGSEWIVLQLDR